MPDGVPSVAVLDPRPGPLHAWFEYAPDWIHAVRPSGEVLFANLAWRDALGYDADDLASMTIFQILAPSCRERCASAVGRLLRGEPVDDHVVTFVAKGGRAVDVDGRWMVVQPPGESPTVIGIFRRAEAPASTGAESAAGAPPDVRLSLDCEERFFRLAEAALDAIAEFDGAGRCLYASEQHRHLLGRDPADLVHRPLVELVHPDDVAPILEGFRVGAAAPRPARPLIRFRHADGSFRWFETTGTWFKTSRGEDRLLTLSRDMSERIQAEDELRRSETRYRAILENSLDMISIIGTNGTITFHDAVAEKVLGYDLAQIGEADFASFVHPDDAPQAFQAVRDCIESPAKAVSVDLRVRHRDGSWRWVTAYGRNLVGVEGIDGILVTSRDVTEQRELQAALMRREDEFHHAQKMEALGRLAGGVAHDFNNLLSVINSYAELLDTEGECGTLGLEYAHAIRAAGDRAARLTRQLLAFSRKQTSAPVVLDLSAAVREVSNLLRRVIGEDVKLTLDLADGLPPVYLDPIQLDQVVMNLAVNARDAMPTGGHLAIATRAGSEPPGGVRLTVSDTGHGMDAETRARIFEPFFTTKAQDRGTGLGLSMVYGVVMHAGGHISVASEPGRGAEFVLDFPPAEDASVRPQARAEAEADTPAGGRTILVVEDDPTVGLVTRRVLELQGHRVHLASGREEALAFAERSSTAPDLVLSDVILSDGNGPSVVIELRARWPRLCALLMSGYVGEMLDERGLESCAADLIEKPFTPASLAQAVERALAQPIVEP